jgi:hypothetical protein
MDGFKKIVKMKIGGSVNKACAGGSMKKGGKYAEGGKADIAQDKAIVKKAFKLHDKQEHEGEKTDLSTLKKGGRSKKAVGTVKKYKAGGAIEMKKSSGDIDKIKKIKATGAKKADAPSKAAAKPAFKGSDVAKEKSKSAGDKDAIKKVSPTGDKKADAKSGAKEMPNKYKKGGQAKKSSDGGVIAPTMAPKPIVDSRRFAAGKKTKKFADGGLTGTPSVVGPGMPAGGNPGVGIPPVDPTLGGGPLDIGGLGGSKLPDKLMYPTDPLPPARGGGNYGQGGYGPGRFGGFDRDGDHGRFGGGFGGQGQGMYNNQGQFIGSRGGFGGQGRFDNDGGMVNNWGGRDMQPKFPGAQGNGIIGSQNGNSYTAVNTNPNAGKGPADLNTIMNAFKGWGFADGGTTSDVANKLKNSGPYSAYDIKNAKPNAAPVYDTKNAMPNAPQSYQKLKGQGAYSDAEINAVLAEMAKRGDFSHTGD